MTDNPLRKAIAEPRDKHKSIIDIRTVFHSDELQQHLGGIGRDALDLAYVHELKRRQFNKYSLSKQQAIAVSAQTGKPVVQRVLGYSLMDRGNGVDDIREVKELKDYHRERKDAVESALSHMSTLIECV